ncbi:MAG TPA: 6-hydroxymethylpterin diphosphokinase MptE-like protein [Methanospirillum sp.]|nr:6-hydroxymethylpterin diphosphokinase MptE-like protein [Methanospirillum sp.]
MKYDEWEPLYLEICDYFDFDPAEDQRAAELLTTLSSADAHTTLVERCKGKIITVCGNAPSLPEEARRCEGTIIAADGAAGVLLAQGIRPDIIVSDLDGIDEYAIELNNTGTILVVHAHGDNVSRLKSWVPRFCGPLVLTTQGRPFLHIHNYGGFTDGDRAVFLAQECGATQIVLIGFDCDDPCVTPMKKGKLIWTRRLLKLAGYDC